MDLILHYITGMLVYMFLSLPFYYWGRKTYLKRKGKKAYLTYELVLGCFVLYIIGLASQTIIPRWNMGIISNTGEFYFNMYIGMDVSRINFIPFKTISSQYYSLLTSSNHISFINLMGNVFLFSPIGFFTSLLWKKWRSFKRILLVGLMTTFLIEFIQVFIGRSSDIDDILLNTIGVVIGYGVFILLSKLNILPMSLKSHE